MIYDITNIDNLVRSYIVSNMQEKFPDINISENSPMDDLFIKPLVGLLGKFLDRANRLEMMQNLDNAEYMTDEEMDSKGEGSYFLERRQGESASALLTLMFANLNVDDPNFRLTVPAGVIFKSSSGAEFETIVETMLSGDDVKKGYDKYRMLYEVDVTVQALDIGTDFNVGANEITDCQTFFSGSYVGATNKAPVTNGKSQESNVEYAARIRDWYTSRQLGTKPGYRNFILESFQEVNDVYVVGYKDKYMERDTAKIVIDEVNHIYKDVHIGGKVDIYIKGSNSIESVAEVQLNTNTLVINVPYASLVDIERMKIYNLSDESKIPVIASVSKIDAVEFDGKFADLTKIIIDNDGDKSYSSDIVSNMRLSYTRLDDAGNTVSFDHYFAAGISTSELSCPLIDITNMTCTDIEDIGDIKRLYDLTFTGERGTTDEQCYITMKNVDSIPNGSIMRVNYLINDTLRRCSLSLNNESNRIVTTDVIVKEAKSIYVNAQFRVKVTDRRTILQFEDIEARIKASVISFFRNYKMGDQVEQSDLVAWLYQDESVKSFIQYIELPFKVFYVPENPDDDIPTDGTELAPGGVLPIREIDYPVLNTAKFRVELIV